MRKKLLSFFGEYWTWNLGQFLWHTFGCSISFQMEGLPGLPKGLPKGGFPENTNSCAFQGVSEINPKNL